LSTEESFKSLPLKSLHAGLGARFGEFAGWEMPLWYGGAVDEVHAVRRSAGIFDITHMGRFEVQGDDADAILSSVFSRDFSRVAAGCSIYALACSEGGGILDDLMVYRVAQSRFMVICNAANKPVIGGVLQGVIDEQHLRDVQSDTVLLAVQGPDAGRLVAQRTSGELLDLPPRGCSEFDIGGVSFFAGRTGYTGEDGFEIMTSPEAGQNLFEGLIEDGALPCGLASRDTLRLEASLPLYGLDIDESTTPWEAGLGWAISLDHDFTGSSALSQRRDTTERHLTCLLSDGAGVIRSHQPVFQGDTLVGETSSGGFSPTLDRSIAMAYLPKALGEPGTEFAVEARGRRIPCHVVKRPFYRRADR
jgi:aminomethyltransferase